LVFYSFSFFCIAFFICINSFPGYTASRNWDVERQASVVYGACVLLFRKSGLKDKELGAALGWLSRENKIEFDQCDEELYVIEMKIQKKEKE